MELKFEYCENTGRSKKTILKNVKVNIFNKVVYSTFHDALTQVCFGCKKVRSNLTEEDLKGGNL